MHIFQIDTLTHTHTHADLWPVTSLHISDAVQLHRHYTDRLHAARTQLHMHIELTVSIVNIRARALSRCFHGQAIRTHTFIQLLSINFPNDKLWSNRHTSAKKRRWMSNENWIKKLIWLFTILGHFCFVSFASIMFSFFSLHIFCFVHSLRFVSLCACGFVDCDYFVYAQNNWHAIGKIDGKMGGMLTKCENHKSGRFSKCIIIFALSPNRETISACTALFSKPYTREELDRFQTNSVYREQQQK